MSSLRLTLRLRVSAVKFIPRTPWTKPLRGIRRGLRLSAFHTGVSLAAKPCDLRWLRASVPPRQEASPNSTRSRPRRNSRRLAWSGRLRTAVASRIGKALSANRRMRNFRAIIRAMRVCPPEYRHIHSRWNRLAISFREVAGTYQPAPPQGGAKEAW